MRTSWCDKRQFYIENTKMANPQAIRRRREYPYTRYWSFLLLRNWEIWICKAHRLNSICLFQLVLLLRRKLLCPWLSKCCVLNLQSKQKREEKERGMCLLVFIAKIEFASYRACVFRQIAGSSQWFLKELSTRIHCSWLSQRWNKRNSNALAPWIALSGLQVL